MKNKIFLLALLLCTACGLNKPYTIYQYDNGDDYVKDGTIRIVDTIREVKKSVTPHRTEKS